MRFRKGDKVLHDDGDFGIGTVVEDRGRLGGVQTYRVAFRMPEGAMAQVLSVPEGQLRPADAPARGDG
jgi:hypothetical protein